MWGGFLWGNFSKAIWFIPADFGKTKYYLQIQSNYLTISLLDILPYSNVSVKCIL